MGVIEILIAVMLASGAGYQAGKAGQKADSVQSKKVCFDEAYGDREAGCYHLVAPSEASDELTKKSKMLSHRKLEK